MSLFRLIVEWVIAFAVAVALALAGSASVRTALIAGAVVATGVPILTKVFETVVDRPAQASAGIRQAFPPSGVGLSARRRAEARRADEARRR